MEDYQILIDLAWSQNPDIFGIIRKYLQDHLDNRRPFLAEFQNKLHQRWDRRGTHHSETINDLHSFSKMNCMRRFLPVKISRNITRLHPSKFWMTPIDTIHPTRSHQTRDRVARSCPRADTVQYCAAVTRAQRFHPLSRRRLNDQ